MYVFIVTNYIDGDIVRAYGPGIKDHCIGRADSFHRADTGRSLTDAEKEELAKEGKITPADSWHVLSVVNLSSL